VSYTADEVRPLVCWALSTNVRASRRGLTVEQLQARVAASPSLVTSAVRELEQRGDVEQLPSGRLRLTGRGLVGWWAYCSEHAASLRDAAAVELLAEGGASYADVAGLVGLGSRTAAHRRYADRVAQAAEGAADE